MLKAEARRYARRAAVITDKVRPHHLERKALLYVRQSSAHHVRHNRESSALQYACGDGRRSRSLMTIWAAPPPAGAARWLRALPKSASARSAPSVRLCPSGTGSRDTVILPGVRIGTRAVIGTGSIVTEDIPPRGVAGGSGASSLLPSGTRQGHAPAVAARWGGQRRPEWLSKQSSAARSARGALVKRVRIPHCTAHSVSNRRTNLTPDWIWVNLQLTIEAEGPRVLEA
jgi:hypothetical protein